MVMTKSNVLEKEKATEILNSFLVQFQHSCNQKRPPHSGDYEKLLSHHFMNSSNGKLIGKNTHEFLERIKKVQEKFSHIEIAPLKDCLISGSNAVFQFNIDLTSQKGQKTRLFAMAIATFDGEHITQWSQVSHPKDVDHTDS